MYNIEKAPKPYVDIWILLRKSHPGQNLVTRNQNNELTALNPSPSVSRLWLSKIVWFITNPLEGEHDATRDLNQKAE